MFVLRLTALQESGLYDLILNEYPQQGKKQTSDISNAGISYQSFTMAYVIFKTI